MGETENSFIRLVKHPVKFRMFLFNKLPSAFFSGVRVRHIDDERCVVTIPYKWFSQNPFRSTYFACLAMAAEMSTGLLSMKHTYKKSPAISMLVVGLEATYFKKATGITVFTCEEGTTLKTLVAEAIHSGEARSARIKSTGKNEAGVLVAEFFITWSFKVKS
ncbi:MAG: DUF4442 domain-containing protein [Ferruginibacter sp.]|nr:DUF4442 domain-containing protein [Ferruginibacter sp.]